MQEAVLKIQKLVMPPEGFEEGGCPEDMMKQMLLERLERYLSKRGRRISAGDF